MNDLHDADLDAIAYGIARLFHTPMGQLRAEAAKHRSLRGGSPRTMVGSRAGAWANQALDYALNTDAPFVATAYLTPEAGSRYYTRTHWVVYGMRSRQDLDDWYKTIVANPDRFHYVAAFDKTTPEWTAGRPIAVTAEPGAYTSGEIVGAVPIRDQLAQLDRVIGAHETYWAAVAQYNPRSTLMRDFLGRYWDPWFTNWTLARSRLDHQRTVYDQGYPRAETVLAPESAVAAFVREAAQGLSAMREFAAQRGIPTVDLGTSQHGFVHEEPRMAG